MSDLNRRDVLTDAMSVSDEVAASSLDPGRMVRLPGGPFLMGSDDFYPEERPAHRVTVPPFSIDAYPVTNASFRRFVDATGYVTVAERTRDAAERGPSDGAPGGSLVFRFPHLTGGPLDQACWWSLVPGACWRHPEGPGSDLAGRDDHPVVHVAFEDAQAYARWAGKALPTEAEWEYAARGGLEGATFAWGNDFAPGGRLMANVWVGEFPWQRIVNGEHLTTSPVGAYLPNGYGLFDMMGNVWEWTVDRFRFHPWTGRHRATDARADETAPGPVLDDVDPEPLGEPHHVVKGGSYLSAANYSFRYRPAARRAQQPQVSAAHLGFRCVVRETDG